MVNEKEQKEIKWSLKDENPSNKKNDISHQYEASLCVDVGFITLPVYQRKKNFVQEQV